MNRDVRKPMRLGLYVSGAGSTLDAMAGRVAEAARLGYDSAFFSQVLSWDALTVAALSAERVPGIDVGTAVVQTYPRHPVALAGQALTAQVASRNRLTLGLGPSHPPVIEDVFGYTYEPPARHLRAYLTALRPLLRGSGQVEVPGAEPPSVVVSALGPAMLRVAGELADGTVTVWAGPEILAGHVVPGIARAASGAGRPAPRVVAIVGACVTLDPDGARQRFAERWAAAGRLPSYRALLDRQGMAGVHETLVAGGDAAVTGALRRYGDAGATELVVSPFGTEAEQARTVEAFAALRGRVQAPAYRPTRKKTTSPSWTR